MPKWLKRVIEKVVLELLAELFQQARPDAELPPPAPADTLAGVQRKRAIAAAMFRPGR